MLDAFGIDQSLRNVLLVQASQSLATLVPVSPGGVGTEQAFLVYTLRGQAPRSALLAFSVGMKLTLTAVNVVARLHRDPAHVADGPLPQRPTAGAEPGRAVAAQESQARRCGGAGRTPTRAVFAGSPGTASSSSCEAARKRSAEPKCCRIARRRAGPMPSSVSKIDSNARVSRFWR